jgi:solute carrier family 15 oligopeptide transporter 1
MGKGYGYFTGYPKHVFFILGNEFCERFSFYGMKAILVIYLNRALNYNEDTATAIYHGFNMACYFMPIFGAMLADGLIGKYKTILYVSVIYAIGNVVMAAGSIPVDGSYIRWPTYLGLGLIAVGTGGIKPCVSAFGADQFSAEDGTDRFLETFFSLFYMSINLGSLLSMVITPIIRSSITCYDDDCYFAAFGIPALLMIVALVFFVVGTKWYRRSPPGNNIIGRLFGCVGHAICARCKWKGDPKEHWLDYSHDKYDVDFVTDVKAVMRVLFMFLPLPIFWALFDQQGSRWTFQAGELNGDLGAFVMQPDMMQVINPIIVVLLVPLFETLLFPCLDKLNIPNSPLQRLGAGMFLAGVAFLSAGFLQIAINNSQPPGIKAAESRITLINSSPCDIKVYIGNHHYNVPYLGAIIEQDIPSGEHLMTAQYCGCYEELAKICHMGNATMPLDLEEKEAYQYMYTYFENADTFTTLAYDEDDYMGQAELVILEIPQNVTGRTKKGLAATMIANAIDFDLDVFIDSPDERGFRWRNISAKDEPAYEELIHATYDFTATPEAWNTTCLIYNDKDEPELIGAEVGAYDLGDVRSRSGAVYFVSIQYSRDKYPNGTDQVILIRHEIIGPNDINIFIMVPQYVIMSMGEVFFSVTGLSFAYTQSPASMKAVLQAAWLLTLSFGNLIVMIIAGASLGNPMAEFFMFAGMMFVTVIIFAVMSLSYTYVDYTETDDDKKEPLPGGMDNDAFTLEEDSAKQKEAEANTYANIAEPPPYSEVESTQF